MGHRVEAEEVRQEVEAHQQVNPKKEVSVTKPAALRVALYARTSTMDQHPEMQLVELRAVAAQRGWLVVKEFVDEGQSGGKDRRPALDELMQLTAVGGIDLVAVWKFDRFARSTQHLLRALETFRLQGVEFFSQRDAIDTSTPAGRFAFTIIAAVGELERELIRERVRAGVVHAQKSGKHCGRPAKVVNLAAVQQMRKSGMPLREIATALGCGLATLHRIISGRSERVAETEPTSPSQTQEMTEAA